MPILFANGVGLHNFDATDPNYADYFARSNLTYFNQTPYNFPDGAGSHISSILDTGSINTTWYTLADVLASDWYPKDFPFQPQPGACNNILNDAFDSGAPLPGYDAPGQHIEDAAGNYWPQARYIQYRVNLYTRDETLTPELDSLTLYYDTQSMDGDENYYTYIPLIMK